MAAMRDAQGRFVKTEVQINTREIIIALEKVNKEVIRAVALQTEAHTKKNIATPFRHKDGSDRGQIDTAAMLNSTRAIFSGLPPGVDAAVISPQHYAPYQEAIRAFLWPAAEESMRDFNATASKVIKTNWPKSRSEK